MFINISFVPGEEILKKGDPLLRGLPSTVNGERVDLLDPATVINRELASETKPEESDPAKPIPLLVKRFRFDEM